MSAGTSRPRGPASSSSWCRGPGRRPFIHAVCTSCPGQCPTHRRHPEGACEPGRPRCPLRCVGAGRRPFSPSTRMRVARAPAVPPALPRARGPPRGSALVPVAGRSGAWRRRQRLTTGRERRPAWRPEHPTRRFLVPTAARGCHFLPRPDPENLPVTWCPGPSAQDQGGSAGPGLGFQREDTSRGRRGQACPSPPTGLADPLHAPMATSLVSHPEGHRAGTEARAFLSVFLWA